MKMSLFEDEDEDEDITSLYGVIPNNEGLLALKYFFDQRANKQPCAETLIRLAEPVLRLNCFSFLGNVYKQFNGVAQDSKMGPSYANLFVSFIEKQFFDQFHDTKPNITAVTSMIALALVTDKSLTHPAFKCTWAVSECSITFLDIKVSISDNRLFTCVYYKPTDSHSYLLHASSHSAHVKNSIL